jgi:DNA-directed RNA polymerase subunit RPC12/RpoP
MSQKTTELVACPFCGHKQKMTLWAVVNGEVNTKTKKKIIDGKLFEYQCENCGNTHVVSYPTLYEDDSKNAMVYFAGNMEHWIEANQIVDKRRSVVEAKYDYAIRIADSINEFIEKVSLIDHDLDDRIIEIIKAVLLEKISSNVRGAQVDEIRCSVMKDGSLELTFLGIKPGSVVIAKDFYGYVKNKCSSMLNRQDPNPVIVDLDWAIEFLAKNHFVIE